MVETKVIQTETGYAVEGFRDIDGTKVYQDLDPENEYKPIATMTRAQELEIQIKGELENYIPPEPPKPQKTEIELLKEENEKLKQDLKSTQAAVDFILLNY